jgi:hypothetical protein
LENPQVKYSKAWKNGGSIFQSLDIAPKMGVSLLARLAV